MTDDRWEVHERIRWKECDEWGLMDRLDKIKNPLKLKAFILMAQEHQSYDLYLSACAKARELGYGWIIPRGDKMSKLSPDLKKPEPEIRKIRT